MNAPCSSTWLLLTASLSGRTASTGRVRLWRALKDLGVGNLRHGVSLSPASDAARSWSHPRTARPRPWASTSRRSSRVAAFLALWRYKIGIIPVIAASAGLGLAYSLVI